MGQRIKEFVTSCIAQLKMQMRTERVACISGIRKELATLHGIITRQEIEVYLKALLVVLVFAHTLCQSSGETVQMSIHRHITVMHDIKCHTIACRLDLRTVNITIGHAFYWLAHHSAGLEIEPRMEMVGAQLAIARAQQQVEVERTVQGVGCRRLRRGTPYSYKQKQYWQYLFKTVFHFLNIRLRIDDNRFP